MRTFRSLIVVILSVLLLTSASFGKSAGAMSRVQASVVTESTVRVPLLMKLCKQHFGQGSAACVAALQTIAGVEAFAGPELSGALPFAAGSAPYRFVPELELPPPRLVA